MKHIQDDKNQKTKENKFIAKHLSKMKEKNTKDAFIKQKPKDSVSVCWKKC